MKFNKGSRFLVLFMFMFLILCVCLTACKVKKDGTIAYKETTTAETTTAQTTEETTAETTTAAPETTAAHKTNEEIANEVVAGWWGSGTERIENLTKEGYDAEAIQQIVNSLIPKTEPKQTKAVETAEDVPDCPECRAQGPALEDNGLTYVGTYRMTAYCKNCDNGITAMGTAPVVGRTVAFNGLPLGTQVYIKGYGYYTVEDRGGMSGLDLYVNDCTNFPNPYVELYVVG